MASNSDRFSSDAHLIRVNPQDEDILYMGIDDASQGYLMISTDRGQTWGAFGTGLPEAVQEIVFDSSGNVTAVLTYRNGLYQLVAQ